MTPLAALTQRLNQTADVWFKRPEPNAAGRAGLYRIIFAAFYLWCLSGQRLSVLSGFPRAHTWRFRLFTWVSYDLPPWTFDALESILVAALVLLLAGYRTQITTVVVLVAGCIVEACFGQADVELAYVLLVFYIPLFMALNGGRWGDTYSVDAAVRRSKGGVIKPADSSGLYAMPARATLAVLAMLFMSAGVLKVFGAGTWPAHPEFIANLALDHNVRSAMYGLSLNPAAPFVAQSPLVYTSVRYHVPLFEGLFFLALLGPRLRNVFLASALVFHAVGGIWLIVTFAPVLVTYGLFVDWQRVREHLWRPRRRREASAPALVAAALLLAAACATLWNTWPPLRAALSLGGLVTWRTIWYPVLPLALAWLAVTILDLVSAARRPSVAPITGGGIG